MKHYLCFDENQLVYAYGTFAAGVFQIEKADYVDFTTQGLEAAVAKFVLKNKLKGQPVTIALGSRITFHVFCLPQGRRKAVKAMVHNELNLLAGAQQDRVVSIVPTRPGHGRQAACAESQNKANRRSDRVPAYTILRGDWDMQQACLKHAGIRCRKAYVMADCLSELVAKQFPDQKQAVVVYVAQMQIRLMLIVDGQIALLRVNRLNAKHFCKTGAYSLLYDEITEQITKIIQHYQSLHKPEALGVVVLVSDVLADEAAAKVLGDNLSIPCVALDLPLWVGPGLDPALARQCHRAVAIIAKDCGFQSQNVNLLADAKQEYARGWLAAHAGFWPQTVAMLTASAVILAGTGAYLRAGNHRQGAQIQELGRSVRDPKQQQEYQQALAYVDQVRAVQAFAAEAKREEDLLKQAAVLRLEDYYAIRSALAAGCTLTGFRFQQAKGLIEVDILGDKAQDFPKLILRIRETGQFASVTYRYWEQIRGDDGSLRYTMTILAELGKE